MFSYLIEVQEKYGHGTHGYIKCAELARKAAVAEPEAAVSHALLANLAEDFIDRNERMPVSSIETEAAFAQYAEAISQLQTAHNSSDAATILTVVNKITVARLHRS